MNCCVDTKNGRIRGLRQGGALAFHNIPYAKAPVGALRFAVPVPAEPWDGELDGTVRGCICPQHGSDLDLPMGPNGLPCSEDCLTLAVSTPSTEGRRPVAVWFHGGANCFGGGDMPWYDGAALAAATDTVVVCINFRLGPFGFLFADGLIPANLCIEDQMLALRWVQENITDFGGDPERVTLFGQSAGANAIAHILSREDSRGLFHQIVLQSPSLGRGNHLTADAHGVGLAVLKNLGVDMAAPDAMEQLRSFTAEELLQAAEAVPGELKAKYQGMYFKPVMDAWHTPSQTAQRAAAMAAERKIRVMVGFTREETLAFSTARDPESLKALRTGQHLRYDIPGAEFAAAAAAKGCDVWKYRFDWAAPESIFGACHCLELPPLFGNADSWDAPFLAGATREELDRLTVTLQREWGWFFRGETPPEGQWPRYTGETRQLRFFDNMENPVGAEPDYPV